MDAGELVNSGPAQVEAKFLETKRALKFTGWGSGTLLFLVFVTLVVRMVRLPDGQHGSLLAGIAVPCAAFAAGVLLGLLFAIPLIVNGSGAAAPGPDQAAEPGESSAPASPGTQRKPAHNDSLVRVSQWLATVIVGASLVQLNDLLAALDRSGAAVTVALLGCPGLCDKDAESVGVVGTALIVAFAIGGFLVGYLWTRVIFYIELWGVERATDGDTRAATARAVSTGLVQKDPGKMDVSDATTMAENAEAVAVAAGAVSPGGPSPIVNPDDPLKGLFGGQSVTGGYRLTADVRRSNMPNFFTVKLLVAKTGSGEAAREAEFFLHPTFPRNRVKKKMNKYGNATLPVLAWGAFTVGVELDTGVRLELDLSEVDDAPQVFKDR